MRAIRWALLAVVFAAAVSVASAQTGGLQIEVVDATGPLPTALVTLSSDVGFIKETTVQADMRGVALFPVLRAGAGYRLTIRMPGYAQQVVSDVRVKINETVGMKIQLFQEIVETVEVTARTNPVDLDKAETSTKFSDEFIQDLPVPGRFYQNVLTLAPGVNDDNGDGNPTVHGSRNRDFKTTVGGVSNVDPLTGQFMSLVNSSSIEEMEVVTAGAGVEFGRAQGGFAQIIQKQGSNDFEGLAEFIYRSSALDGNGATGLTGDQVPEFDWFQPSVQLSGPIVRDKLWYRLSHEYIYREDPVNTGSTVSVVTTEQGINSDQLTWQASPRNKLAFSYEWNPRTQDNAGVSSLVPESSTSIIDTDYDNFRLAWTAPYSPKILVESLASFQERITEVEPTDPSQTNRCINDPSRPLLEGALCNDIITGEVSGAATLNSRAESQRFFIQSIGTVYGGRFWGANHQFKLGFEVANERYFQEAQINPTIFRFVERDIDDTVSGGGVDISRQEIFLGRFSVPRDYRARATTTVWGMFVEDQFKPLQNLTVTLGLRVDSESTNAEGLTAFNPEDEQAAWTAIAPTLGSAEKVSELGAYFTAFPDTDSFRREIARQIGGGTTGESVPCRLCDLNARLDLYRQPDNVSISNVNFAPRLNVSWDPWSNGKTKISGSIGRYYNTIPLVVPLVEVEPTIADVELNCLNGTCVPSTGSDVNPTVSAVSRDLRTPYNDEWTIGFEREIAAETVFRATYINRKYRDQLQDIDVNHVPGDYGRCVPQLIPGAPTLEPITDPSDPLFGLYPNGGDGVLDDCIGKFVEPPNTGGGEGGGEPDLGAGLDAFLQEPDGIADLYTQNPVWGSVYVIGNYNFADYDGVTLEILRRQYRGWEMNASYTWSRAVGNGEDYGQQIGDDRTLLEDEYGYQSNDRRHAIKFNATTITPWGIRLGTAVSWLSGLPFSILQTQASRDAIPPALEGLGFPAARPRNIYVSGVRNDERNQDIWNIDLKATKEFRVGNRANMQVSAEVYNLLDDGSYIIYNPFLEYGRQINGVNDAYYQFGRRYQLGAKVTF